MRSIAAAGLALLLLAVSPSAAAAEDDGRLRLASITPWVATGGAFEVHLAGGAEGLELDVSLYGRVRSRSQFTQTLDMKLLGRPVKQASLTVDDLALGGDGTRLLSLPLPRLDAAPTPLTLPPLREGVYPVMLSLRRDTTTVDRIVTYLVRLPDGPIDHPLAVAVVLPLRAAPRGDGAVAPASRRALADAAQVIGPLADLDLTLDASAQALAALSPQELEPVRQAVAGGDQLLASPWVPVEPAALAAAGRGDDLAAQRQAGEDGLLDTIGARGDPRTWSVDGSLTPAAASRLRDLGVTQVVVPESTLQPLAASATDGRTLTHPFRLAGAGDEEPLDAVSAEPALTAHFREGGDQVLAAHQLLADLAYLFFDAPGTARGVVVRPPGGWRPNATFLTDALPALGAAPIIRTVTVDELFTVVPFLGTPKAITRVLDPAAAVTSLPAASFGGAARSIDELASLVGGAGEVVDGARRRLLLSETSPLPGRTRRALLADVTGALDQVRAQIHVAGGRTYRLTARTGTIAVTITNDNAFPVHVDLELSSEKLEFREVEDGDRSELVVRDLVVAPAKALTRTVPVRARASATFSVRARILAPTGDELGRSRSTVVSLVFSGVGVALSVAAGLFLLVWWGSHWRTVRRGRRLVDVAA